MPQEKLQLIPDKGQPNENLALTSTESSNDHTVGDQSKKELTEIKNLALKFWQREILHVENLSSENF